MPFDPSKASHTPTFALFFEEKSQDPFNAKLVSLNEASVANDERVKVGLATFDDPYGETERFLVKGSKLRILDSNQLSLIIYHLYHSRDRIFQLESLSEEAKRSAREKRFQILRSLTPGHLNVQANLATT